MAPLKMTDSQLLLIVSSGRFRGERLQDVTSAPCQEHLA